jgi:hypothetical protein
MGFNSAFKGLILTVIFIGHELTYIYVDMSLVYVQQNIWVQNLRTVMFVELNIYNVLIKSSLLYGSETWRLTENNKRRVEATEMDALRRSSRISRKERIKNVTIRQQIG